VYVVARPDGTRDEFSDPDEAQAARAATPGAQLRTVPRERDVPAEYVVFSRDGVEMGRYRDPREASVAARSAGGYVMLMAADG
jgi:hypothetical protein